VEFPTGRPLLCVHVPPGAGPMRLILHEKVKREGERSLAWVRAFLSGYDTSLLGWLRIDLGREYKDRLGRRYRKYRGIYGRCWYPTESQPTIRLSCQVPGPFPCDIVTRLKPIYRNPDGTWPPEARRLRGPIFKAPKSDRQWKRVYGTTHVASLDEGILWIFAHEAFHWLTKTRQLKCRNNEIEADAFADGCLADFRAGKPPHEGMPDLA
jgi:hypothetical protein